MPDLRERKVCERRCSFEERRVSCVARDPDHGRDLVPEPEGSADCAAAGREAAGERLVHDYDARRTTAD
jgi:hypothetical protein